MRSLKLISGVYEENYPRMDKLLNQHRLVKVLQIIEKKIPKGPQRILDVGCGNGFFGYILGKKMGAKEVYGIDISKKAATEASKYNIIAKAVDIDVNNLPYKSNFFDFIFCGSLVELVLDPDHLLEELHRVLSPRGKIMITYPNHCAWLSRVAVLLGYNPYYDRFSTKYNSIGKLFIPKQPEGSKRGTGFIRLYSLRSFKELMRLYHFNVINIFGARGETLPQQISLLDRLFANIPSFAFQNICLAQKE